jgi:hypothetical protein
MSVDRDHTVEVSGPRQLAAAGGSPPVAENSITGQATFDEAAALMMDRFLDLAARDMARAVLRFGIGPRDAELALWTVARTMELGPRKIVNQEILPFRRALAELSAAYDDFVLSRAEPVNDPS